MKKLALLSLSLIAASACSDRGLRDPAIKESDPPVLVVEKPLRGTVLPETDTTIVEGFASDMGSGLDKVLVNGIEAELDEDGKFTAEIPLADGVTLVQTTAIDEDENEETDTRAVLQGMFVPPNTVVNDAGAARVNDQTLGAIGLIGAEVLTETDMGAAVQPFNPVLDKGFNCLEVQLSVEDVQKSLVMIDLVPTYGGIAIAADVYDLDVPMHATFEALCIDGSASIDLSASRFHMEGTLALSIDGNDELAVAIDPYSAYFEDFNLDVGIIPGNVIEMIYEEIDDKVAELLIGQIASKVPPIVEAQFDGFGFERSVTLYGMDIDFGVRPSSIDFTPQGGTITIDTRIEVKNDPVVAGGPGFLWTPEALPTMPSSEAPGDGFRLAMADDVVNQALSAFWVAGIFEHSIATDTETSEGLGALIDRVDVYMPFPPTVSAKATGNAASVTAGDIRIDVLYIDSAGNEEIITALALSAEIGIDVETDVTGAVRLKTSSPLAWVDVLEEEVTGPNPLSDAEVEMLSSFVVARLTTMIGGIVGEVPVPSFSSARITNLGTQPTTGYLMLGGNIEPL